MTVVIVDAGLGNLGSIRNMLRRLGCNPQVSGDPAVLGAADKLVLPGVGAFGPGMSRIAAAGLLEPLRQRVLQDRIPILGICLGMQLFTRDSEEGGVGLGWLAARTVRFQLPPQSPLKLPHMGWNTLKVRPGSDLFAGFSEAPRFYFLHSYHVVCDHPEDEAASAMHGCSFTAAVRRHNIWGTQFHPEKSHKFGFQLFRNFLDSA